MTKKKERELKERISVLQNTVDRQHGVIEEYRETLSVQREAIFSLRSKFTSLEFERDRYAGILSHLGDNKHMLLQAMREVERCLENQALVSL